LPRALIDTSAYAHFRRGHSPVVDLIARTDMVLLSVITLGELEAGFTLGTRARENRMILEEFVAEPFVRVLPVSPEIARRYGRLFATLRRAGTPVPINDLWIAASAEDAGANLITYDSDFARIPNLDCTLLEAP
jgi:tRNA(fMet)-specific endonuclease VapC